MMKLEKDKPLVFSLLYFIGPLPTTLGDFWRMIWEKKITNLVMLTGVVEGGKVRE